MLPIWKDKFITLGSATSYRFRIQVSGSTIYEGLAWRRPGSSSVIIRINDICADYMARQMPPVSAGGFTPETLTTIFNVQRYLSGSWSDVETIEFVGDWSYEDRDYATILGLSAPVVHSIPRGAPILYTTLSTDAISLVYTMRSGAEITSTIQIARGADFNDDFNDDYATTASVSSAGTAVIRVTDTNIVGLRIGDIYYKLTDDCPGYELCYLNAFGGWDSLPLTKVVRMSESYEREEMTRSYDNADASARGIYNTRNDVVVEWELHTPLLTDDESRNMRHLLGSTCVFLYSAVDDSFVPVVLSGDFDGATRRSNDLKPVTYTINARLAQSRMRR